MSIGQKLAMAAVPGQLALERHIALMVIIPVRQAKEKGHVTVAMVYVRVT